MDISYSHLAQSHRLSMRLGFVRLSPYMHLQVFRVFLGVYSQNNKVVSLGYLELKRKTNAA